jgi:hypothetical protein
MDEELEYECIKKRDIIKDLDKSTDILNEIELWG